jgi:hypothetical protein
MVMFVLMVMVMVMVMDTFRTLQATVHQGYFPPCILISRAIEI